MDPSTVDGKKFLIDGQYTFTFMGDDQSVRLYPSQNLMRYHRYLITILPGIADYDGKVMSAPYTFSFTTETNNDLIAGHTPLNDQSGIALDAVIEVYFTGEINPATINLSTVSLTGGSIGSLDYTDRVLTITPAENFQERQSYGVILKESIAELDGTTLGEDYIFSFTAENPLGDDAIYVVSEIPGNGAFDVPVETDISLYFSKLIDATSVSLDDLDVGEMDGTLEVYRYNIVFDPLHDLSYDSTYTISFNGDITDTSGHTEHIEHTWSFHTTAIDTRPPRVVGTSPVDGFQKASVFADVILIFSEPIDPTGDHSSFRLSQGYDNPVIGNIFVSGTDLIFNPVSDLVKGATYTASYNGDVSDLSGNTAHINFSWSFRADYFTAVSVYPANRSGCVPFDVEPLIECPAPVDASTVTPDMITVTYGDGRFINGTVSVEDRFILFTPGAPLSPLTEVIVEVKSGIETIDGQGMLGPKWSFWTKGENLLPLAIGNKWVYSIYKFNPYEGSSSYIDSIVIVRDTVIDNKTYYCDQRGRLFRSAADTIETSFLSEYDIYKGYTIFTLVNEDCEYGASIVETDLGNFACQHFSVDHFTSYSFPYSIGYNFSSNVGPVTFYKHLDLGTSGRYEDETWTMIRYELK
jgi:hypothetical protein